MRRSDSSGHFYLRRLHTDGSVHPFGILAMRKEGDKVRIATALCHPNDEFSKHAARAAAYGRLNSETQSTLLSREDDRRLYFILKNRHPAHNPATFLMDMNEHQKHFDKMLDDLFSR